MKNIYIISLFLFVFVLNISVANAQDELKVVSHHFTQADDSLYITFDYEHPNMNVSANKAIYYTPFIGDQERIKELPSISLMGKFYLKNYDRKWAVKSKKQKRAFVANGKTQVLTNNRKGQTYTYNAGVAYEPWMKNASLYIRNEDCGCGKVIEKQTESVARIQPQQQEYTPSFFTAYIVPQVEMVKNRSVECEAVLDFIVGKSDLILDRNNNAAEMMKIIETLNSIKNDDKVKVTAIDIYGYASPEGNIEANRLLSVDRALVLKSYLMSQYTYPASYYGAHFGYEDWDGLIKVLQTSGKPYAEAIINIIENTDDVYTRKSLIEKYQNGVPYKEMLQRYYPPLRRVVFKASFEVDAFDIEEAKALVHTQPQYVSLNELYVVANSYDPHSAEFKEMFDIAAKTYPTNDVANINAAINAIENENYEQAQQYLLKVNARNALPQYINAKGIIAWKLHQDIDMARKLFEQAKADGLKEAENNLWEIEKTENNQ